MSIYCTYLTFYSGSKLPPFYIGSSSVEKVNSGYHGSVSSKKYTSIYKSELKINPHLFKTKILRTFETRTEALKSEHKLQKHLNVIKSNMYFNESFAAPYGCMGMDVSGKLNPMYGKGYKISGSKNGMYGNTQSVTVKDKTGKCFRVDKTHPLYVSGEYTGVGTNVLLGKLTKSKNPNMKKYKKIILLDPNNIIINLNWNEYHEFFELHKLNNIMALKNVKGFKVLSFELNPNWKINPPRKLHKNIIV